MKRLIASFAVLGLIAAPAMAVTKSSAPTSRASVKMAAKASKKSAKLVQKAAAAKPASKTN